MIGFGGNAAPNRICELAQIDIPIIQAPMTYIAGARLAAAVSNAGALGIIETTSDQGRADLRRVRDLTDGDPAHHWTAHECFLHAAGRWLLTLQPSEYSPRIETLRHWSRSAR